MGLLGSPHLTDSSGTNAWGLLARGAHAGRGGGYSKHSWLCPLPLPRHHPQLLAFPQQVTWMSLSFYPVFQK